MCCNWVFELSGQSLRKRVCLQRTPFCHCIVKNGLSFCGLAFPMCKCWPQCPATNNNNSRIISLLIVVTIIWKKKKNSNLPMFQASVCLAGWVYQCCLHRRGEQDLPVFEGLRYYIDDHHTPTHAVVSMRLLFFVIALCLFCLNGSGDHAQSPQWGTADWN